MHLSTASLQMPATHRPACSLVLCACIWLFISAGSLFALDLPVYAGVMSANHVSWYPNRPIKDISWDEKYILELGINEITKGDWTFSGGIKGEPWHTSFRVEFDHLSISYQTVDWHTTGMTAPSGVGSGYFFQQLMVLDADFNRHLFDNHRFNGIEIGKKLPLGTASLAWGGNNRNQAILDAGLDGEYGPIAYNAVIKAVTQDTHWNSPAIQPSMGVKVITPILTFRSNLAWNHLIAYRDRPRRDEWFLAAELDTKLTRNINVCLSGTHTQREFYPYSNSRVNASMGIGLGQLEIIPLLDIRFIDEDKVQSTGLIGQWHLSEASRVGVYYRFCESDEAEGHHVFGLQSDLHLSF